MAGLLLGTRRIFGAGKVMVFGEVIDKDNNPYGADLRAVLKDYANQAHQKEGLYLKRRQRN